MKTWLTKIGGNEFKVMRLQDATTDPGVADDPQKIVNYIRAQIAGSVVFNTDTENLIVITLSTRRHPIGWTVVSTGTLDTLLVHPREIFKVAIVANAAAIVLVHNHPSGDPTPSEADVKVTRDIIRAGQLMKIELLDHVILGTATPERPKDWCSLRELGYFYT